MVGPTRGDEVPWFARRGGVGDTRDDGVRTANAEREVAPRTPRRVDGGVVDRVELEVSVIVHEHDIGGERMRVYARDQGKRGERARERLR